MFPTISQGKLIESPAPDHSFLKNFRIVFDEKNIFLNKIVKELDEYIFENTLTNLTDENFRFLQFRSLLFETFAISKAEDSDLKIADAKKLLELFENFKDKELTNETNPKILKNYRKLEFINIIKGIKEIEKFKLKELNLDLILKIHAIASESLDKFEEFTKNQKYNKSRFRKNKDNVKLYEGVSSIPIYEPPDEKIIIPALKSLINWIKSKKKIKLEDISGFHAMFYAIHPFSNGNKRVARILEHLLIKEAGFNKNSLYNLSYYYHIYKIKYYKNLITAIRFKNLKNWIKFASEGVPFMALDVVRKQIELERKEFLESNINYREVVQSDKIFKRILNRFCEKKHLQIKELNRIANITIPALLSRLQKLEEMGLIKSEKFKDNKKNRYTINIESQTEKYFEKILIYILKNYKGFPLSDEMINSIDKTNIM